MNCSYFSFQFGVEFDAVSDQKGKHGIVSALPMTFNDGTTTWILKYYVSCRNNVVFFLEFQGSIMSTFKVKLFIYPFGYKSLTSTHLKFDPLSNTGKTDDIEYWVVEDGKPDAMYTSLSKNNCIFRQSFSVRVEVEFTGLNKKSHLTPRECIEFANLKNKLCADVELICGEEKMYVHRAVLDDRSKVLSSLCNDRDSEERRSQIVLFGFSPEVLKQYVFFLYAERENSSTDMSQFEKPSFVASENYQPNKLMGLCHSMLCSIVCEQNVFDILGFASKWCLRELWKIAGECCENIDESYEAVKRRELNPPAVNEDLKVATSLYIEIFLFIHHL